MSEDSQTRGMEGLCYGDGTEEDIASPGHVSGESPVGSPPRVQQLEAAAKKKKSDSKKSASRDEGKKTKSGSKASASKEGETLPPSTSSGKGTSAKDKGKKSAEGGEAVAQKTGRTIDGSPTLSTAATVAKLGLDSRYEVLLPESSARPWTPPSGFLCVYESFFKDSRLVFPLPRPLVDFCVRKDIALSQLTPFAVLQLVALLVFGAEAKQLVDADFLEKSVTLVSLKTTPGTFYLQTKRGFLTRKPSKAKGTTNAGEWSDFYFFVRATPDVVGVGAPSLRQDWNRRIGAEYKDQRPDGYSKSHELLVGHLLDVSKGRTHEALPLSRVEEAIEAINSVDWDDFRERPRVEKEVRTRSGKRKRTTRPELIAEVTDQPSLLDGLNWDAAPAADASPRPVQGGKTPRAMDQLRERAGVQVDARENANEDEGNLSDLPLEDRRAGKRAKKTKKKSPVKIKLGLSRGECLEETRKANEARKRKEAAKHREEVAQPSTAGPTPGLLFPQTAGQTQAPASFLSPNFVPPELELPTAGSGLAGIDGQGSAGGEIPAEMEEVDPKKRHKVSFKYRGEVPLTADSESCLRLLRRIPEMEDGVPESDLRNPALVSRELAVGHVWLLSLQGRLERAHEAELDELKGQLVQRTWDLGAAEGARCKLAEELEQEKERARASQEELAAQNRRVEELKLEVEKFRRDYVASDAEVARLHVKLDIAGRALEESEGKVSRMNGMCRRQVTRMLKGQRSKFRTACRKQSRRAVRVVQGYLEGRRPWNRVDKLVSQAEEAERILLRLRADGVPIPEDKLASVVAAKEKYSLERSSIQQKMLSAGDFEFVVPSDLGDPNVDQMDFSSVLPYGEEDEEYYGGSTDEEDRGEEDSVTEGEEGEEEDEEEEDEEGEVEEEVPQLTKGESSGAQPREVEETGEVEPAADGATPGLQPEGGSVRSAPDGSVPEVQLGVDTQLEGERTPPAIGGATSEVPGGSGLERVQLEGDDTPPTLEA